MRQVVAVDRPVAEGEECREGCVHQVCRNQIEQYVPSWILRGRRPRPNDWIPEKNRRPQKAQVFEFVPVFVLECKVVGGGNMPAKKREIHCKPGN